MSIIKLYIPFLNETYILSTQKSQLDWTTLVRYTEEKLNKPLLCPEFCFQTIHQGELNKLTFSGSLTFDLFLIMVKQQNNSDTVKISLIEPTESNILQNSQFEVIQKQQSQLQGENQQQQQTEELLMHPNVRCDICKAYPINGIRYKCYICKNFDTCQDCRKNHTKHPLIAIENQEHQKAMKNKFVEKMQWTFQAIGNQFQKEVIKENFNKAKQPFVKAQQKVSQFIQDQKKIKNDKIKVLYLEEMIGENIDNVDFKKVVLENPNLDKFELVAYLLNQQK